MPQRREDDPEANIDETKVSRVARDEHDEEELADEESPDPQDVDEDDFEPGEGPDA